MGIREISGKQGKEKWEIREKVSERSGGKGVRVKGNGSAGQGENIWDSGRVKSEAKGEG